MQNAAQQKHKEINEPYDQIYFHVNTNPSPTAMLIKQVILQV